MKTERIILSAAGEDSIKEIYARAGRIIREGGLVAFPTETVYGLGADALNEEAAGRIYAAKGRPSDNPLIVHIAESEAVKDLAEEVPGAAKALMKAFWPGPLTLIFRKKSHVPDGTTGGLPTVAVRMPSHPVAKALIRAGGRPIAAPSANRSGRPSPTLADHVMEDLNGKIPMILDGGPVEIGIESTIVDVTEKVPLILRPGYISGEDLGEVLGEPVRQDPAIIAGGEDREIRPRAPGMKYRHYAPRGILTIVEGPVEAVAAAINEAAARDRKEGHRVGVIATRETVRLYEADAVREVGTRARPETVAAGLYRILREFDALDCDLIYSESFSEKGLGGAIMNRLLKAAGHRVMKP